MISISQSKLTEVFDRLYSWIGSFWSKVYTDPEFIKHIQEGRALRLAQLYLDLLENLKLMDRKNIPVFHRERWYPIIIRKSEANKGDINLIRIGSENTAIIGDQKTDSVYGEGSELRIGTEADFVGVETYPIHGKVDNVVTCIVDSIINPKTILRKGTDFILDYNCIGICQDQSPFNSTSTFPKFERIEDGDLETVLWGCDAIIDKDYVNDYLGYIIGTTVESSESGKNTVNSYWDMLNYANPRHLSEILGNMCGVPFVKEEEETIEVVLDNAVITDKNVYRFDNYTPNYRDDIDSGTKLHRGDYFDTAIQILPFLTDTSKDLFKKTVTREETHVETRRVSSTTDRDALIAVGYTLVETIYLVRIGGSWVETDYETYERTSARNRRIDYVLEKTITEVITVEINILEKLLPSIYIPASITDSGRGFYATWDTMTVEEFCNTYPGATEEICAEAGYSDTIVPAKFFLENLIGANTLYVILDGTKIKNTMFYKYVFSSLVSETIPKYVRLVVNVLFPVDTDVCAGASDATICSDLATVGDDETNVTNVTESVGFRFISLCAKL